MTKNKLPGKIKRYNLGIPADQHRQVKLTARAEGSTVLSVLTRFIRLSLFIYKTTEEGDQVLIRQEGVPDKEILFLS